MPGKVAKGDHTSRRSKWWLSSSWYAYSNKMDRQANEGLGREVCWL